MSSSCSGMAVTLKPLLGQMRTSPPRVSHSVATALPAKSCEPLATLIPDPASNTGPLAVVSEANNSPTGGVVWAAAGKENRSSQESRSQRIFPGKLFRQSKELLYASVRKLYLSMA